MATGINISKANDFTVIGPNAGISVSKAVEYIVILENKYEYDVFPYIPSLGIRHLLRREYKRNKMSDGFVYERTVEDLYYGADGTEGLGDHSGVNIFEITFDRTNVGTNEMANLLWSFFLTHLDDLNEPFYFYNPTEYSPPDVTGAVLTGRYTVKLANTDVLLSRDFFMHCLYSYGLTLIEHRDFA